MKEKGVDMDRKVSVVMALYNGREYLEEQLDSLLGQTVLPDEVILMDDCSTDDTVPYVRDYIARHGLSGKWKLFENPENLGYADNFHKAILHATGEYIFLADQDDVWLPEKIGTMLSVMEANADCSLLCTDYTPFQSGEDAPAIPRKVLRKMPGDGTLVKVAPTPKSIYIGALGCCMCVKRSFYRQIARFRFPGWAQDDFLWKMGLLFGTSYLLHENLVRHRIHAHNTATYGNYHGIEKRLLHFYGMEKAAKRCYLVARERKDDRQALLLARHLKMLQLRIEMMEEKKLWNTVMLLPYLGYYERSRSYFLEIYIVLRALRFR